MRKIFRMASAELNKIFMRPSMFVLATVLVLALILSFTMFKPTSVNTKYTYQLNNTTSMFLKFENEYEGLEENLINAKKNIVEYLSISNDTFDKLKNLSQAAKSQFYDHVYLAVVGMKKDQQYPSITDKQKVIDEFKVFDEKINELKEFLLINVKNKDINFFITTVNFEEIYNTIKALDEAIPSTTDLENFSTSQIVERNNLILTSFDLETINTEIHNLEKIDIDDSALQALLNSYYFPNIIETTTAGVTTYTHTGKLLELYEDVESYYYANVDSANESVINNLNERIAKFYDYIQICKALIENNFELMRIGNKTDDEIVGYNGFSGVSIYNLKLEIATSKYFFDNNTFGYEYLRAFNFGINSGVETNSFDFMFFAMQILSALITLFVVFFACGSISGEQNSGTLKMTAIRPYTRNKIYSGKFLACFNVALILLLVSFVASFAVGLASFGFTSTNALVVINASTVITINPLVLMLIYFLSILIDIVFYISLALLISMLIKQTTISTALTSSIFIASTIISGTATASWIRFIPSTHLGMFKFFTSSNTGLFSFSIVPNVNMLMSALIVIVSILFFDIFGRILFTHKSIDR